MIEEQASASGCVARDWEEIARELMQEVDRLKAEVIRQRGGGAGRAGGSGAGGRNILMPDWTLDELVDNPPDYSDLRDRYLEVCRERDQARGFARSYRRHWLRVSGAKPQEILPESCQWLLEASAAREAGQR